MARRGWALNDRQTTLFGRIGPPRTGPIDGLREFYGNFGGGPGFYAGVNAQYRGDVRVQALHYDNLTDPDDFSATLQNYAWHTRFDSAGASWTPSSSWSLISQWLGGDTCAGDEDACWQFSSAFLLTSWLDGPNRLSARYDAFQMHTYSGPFANRNRGHAWTFAYRRELNEHLSIALEELRVDSSLSTRPFFGEPAALAENQLQLSFQVQL